MKRRDDEAPTSIFQYEMRRRALERQEGRITDAEPTTPWAVPKLPSSSPWSDQPGPGDEPSIDRTTDGDIFIEEQ
jgi:hypothetical protein